MCEIILPSISLWRNIHDLILGLFVCAGFQEDVYDVSAAFVRRSDERIAAILFYKHAEFEDHKWRKRVSKVLTSNFAALYYIYSNVRNYPALY